MLELCQNAGATYTFIVVRDVPATLKVTDFASLSYWISRFCTVMFEPVKHSLNPDVFRIWSARPLPERVPSNNKQTVDDMKFGRNILSKSTVSQ